MALLSEAKSGRDPTAQRDADRKVAPPRQHDAGNGSGLFWHRKTKCFHADILGQGYLLRPSTRVFGDVPASFAPPSQAAWLRVSGESMLWKRIHFDGS